MSSETSLPSRPIDPYQLYQLVHNPDDTLTRNQKYPYSLPNSDPTLHVLSKDVTINQSKKTWARLFLPQSAIPSDDSTSNQNHKLPIIIFFHGSGFIVTSAGTTMYHDFCVDMADNVKALVASIEYRLAPEHRLPAAYEDAMETLRWIRSSQDEWLTQYADYSNCFLMGNSAGGTISYHAGLRLADEVDQLNPLRIQGLILRQPFFGGTKRSRSELRLENDAVLPLCLLDMFWELALPTGADRDHEYCNPSVGDGPKKLDRIKELGLRVLVSVNGGDPLVDRGKELAQLMEEKGVQVVSDFEEEGWHEVEYDDPLKRKRLFGLVKAFISPFAA